MKILWFTWKDRKNPLAGGAEVVNEELAKRLAADGHEVTFLVSGFDGASDKEEMNGYTIIRVGGRWTVYWHAYRYYKKHLQGWADLVIDEMNTIPFFCKFYVKERNILLTYQLCREIWFYQMFFPLSLIGYLLEPIYLRLLNDRHVLTESESTKTDLRRYVFEKEKISVFQIGIEAKPLREDEYAQQIKNERPTILSVGVLRHMKRPHHILEAFEIAIKHIPDLQLWIAGPSIGIYGRRLVKEIEKSVYRDSIVYFGLVDQSKKLKLMGSAHLIIATSIKEGWGLTVTEAASQGTPAIVYDVDGLRDSCKNGTTGVVCEENTPSSLAQNIVSLLSDKEKYEKLRIQAWRDSMRYNKETSYNTFLRIIQEL